MDKTCEPQATGVRKHIHCQPFDELETKVRRSHPCTVASYIVPPRDHPKEIAKHACALVTCDEHNKGIFAASKRRRHGMISKDIRAVVTEAIFSRLIGIPF